MNGPEPLTERCGVYVARCADGSLYTGVSSDIDARIHLHNVGKGAKYTRSRMPVVAVYRERCGDRGAALRREAEIKRLSREEKLRLAEGYAADHPPARRSGRLTEEDFRRMADMERSAYGETYITPPEEAARWYALHPDSCVAFVSPDGGIAGFINLFPVRDEVVRSLESGAFNDSLLRAEDVLDPAAGLKADLFFSCILASPAYRGTGLSMRLVNAALDACAPALPGAGRIYLDAATKGGESVAARLGMRFLRETEHGTRLYRGTVRRFVREARARSV